MSVHSILHVIPSLAQAGAERQLSYLAGALSLAGWDVHVAIGQDGPQRARLEAAGVTLHMLPNRMSQDPRLITHLWSLIRRIHPAILQTWIVQSDLLGGLLSRGPRVPWILSERSSGEAYRSGWKAGLRARLAKRATAVVSNSHAGDRYWADTLGDTVPRFVIPNALPLEEIAAAPARHEAIPRDSRPVIAFVGRTMMVPKNAHGFVLALREVIPATGARAVMCGVGPDRANIIRLIERFRLGDSVQMLGMVPDIWSVIKSANVLVASSFYEGNPNAVLEAIACGCPLVLSDIPAHRAIVDESWAVFVDPGSPTSIAEGIMRVLRDPDAARRRAELAQRQWLPRLSIGEMTAKYERVYQQVLGRV
jgi:glycosyltransferase involved in cell wall biosynthesis